VVKRKPSSGTEKEGTVGSNPAPTALEILRKGVSLAQTLTAGSSHETVG